MPAEKSVFVSFRVTPRFKRLLLLLLLRMRAAIPGQLPGEVISWR